MKRTPADALQAPLFRDPSDEMGNFLRALNWGLLICCALFAVLVFFGAKGAFLALFPGAIIASVCAWLAARAERQAWEIRTALDSEAESEASRAGVPGWFTRGYPSEDLRAYLPDAYARLPKELHNLDWRLCGVPFGEIELDAEAADPRPLDAVPILLLDSGKISVFSGHTALKRMREAQIAEANCLVAHPGIIPSPGTRTHQAVQEAIASAKHAEPLREMAMLTGMSPGQWADLVRPRRWNRKIDQWMIRTAILSFKSLPDNAKASWLCSFEDLNGTRRIAPAGAAAPPALAPQETPPEPHIEETQEETADEDHPVPVRLPV